MCYKKLAVTDGKVRGRGGGGHHCVYPRFSRGKEGGKKRRKGEVKNGEPSECTCTKKKKKTEKADR